MAHQLSDVKSFFKDIINLKLFVITAQDSDDRPPAGVQSFAPAPPSGQEEDRPSALASSRPRL